MNRYWLGLCALALAGSAQAGGLPIGKEWVGDKPLPPPYGVGVDFFHMTQGYEIESLQFSLPGVPAIPPDLVKVESSIQHRDIKFDAWVFPFLNVFALYGKVNARTDVDLRGVPTAQLGLPPLGGQQIKTEEKHAGSIQLIQGFPSIPFAVTLHERANWTPMAGARYVFKNNFELSAEFGGGERRTTLVNGTWRWGGGSD